MEKMGQILAMALSFRPTKAPSGFNSLEYQNVMAALLISPIWIQSTYFERVSQVRPIECCNWTAYPPASPEIVQVKFPFQTSILLNAAKLSLREEEWNNQRKVVAKKRLQFR